MTLRFTDISFVTFTDEHIKAVAEHAGVTVERVKDYLANGEPSDRSLEGAFYRVVGVYPARRVHQEPVDSLMGCKVPHKP